MAQKKGLGKGLGALIPEQYNQEKRSEDVVLMMKLTEIEPNREQPRQVINQESIEELAESIKEHGILQPIIVRKCGEYNEIVAGERRWRAARLAGLKEVPVIVRDYSDLMALEVALIENVQRENLNPVDEALTYVRLHDDFLMTQEDISKRVGKSRAVVANAIRMMTLPKEILDKIEGGVISAGHAKAILLIKDPQRQKYIVNKIEEMDLSVRKTELMVKRLLKVEAHDGEDPALDYKTENLIYYRKIEQDLNSLLGTRVRLANSKNKGKIEIEYGSDDDLERLLGMFKKIQEEETAGD